VAAVAAELPPVHAARLAHLLAASTGPHDRSDCLAAVPTLVFVGAVDQIFEAWARDQPDFSGAAVALALRSASSATARERDLQRIELVWTGPTTAWVPVRQTSAVLVEVINAARRRLTILSFAAYRVDSVLSALQAAADRSVDLRLVLETEADSAGALTVDARHAFSALGDKVQFWVWPGESRVAAGGGHAVLHAKAAVADEDLALVSSANLTGRGLDGNVELGLLVRGGPVVTQLARHLQSLMSSGVFVAVDRG